MGHLQESFAAAVTAAFPLPRGARIPAAPDDPREAVLALFARRCPGWVITESEGWTAHVRGPGEHGTRCILDIASGKLYWRRLTARGARRRGALWRDLMWEETVG